MDAVFKQVLVVGAVFLCGISAVIDESALGQTAPPPSNPTYDVYQVAASSTIAITEFSDPDATGSGTLYDNFGYAVAVSADASTALIGAFSAEQNGSAIGKAYVFDRVNGNWSTTPSVVFANPISTVGDGFGSVVSLSSDGNEALITAPTDVLWSSNNTRVYIYGRTGSVWATTPVATFMNPDTNDQDCFGCTAALSADGSTLLIGAQGISVNNSLYVGKAYLFKQVNGVWSTTPVATFTPPEATKFEAFGSSVALSGDGTTALIGAPEWYGSGKAYVFEESNGTWPSVPTAIIPDPANIYHDYFGVSVALSSNGNTALISGWYTNGEVAVAYVFNATDGLWSTTPTVEFDDPAERLYDNFGSALALSGDGTTALIEGTNQLNRSEGPGCCGVAYVYKKTNGLWGIKPTATLTEPDAAESPYHVSFGASVALSLTGTIALVGDPQSSNFTPPPPSTVPNYGGPGVAYAFETSNGWKQSGSGGGKSGGGAFGGLGLATLLVLLGCRRRGIHTRKF